MVGVNEAKCEERATLMCFWLLLWLSMFVDRLSSTCIHECGQSRSMQVDISDLKPTQFECSFGCRSHLQCSLSSLLVYSCVCCVRVHVHV